MLWGRRHQHWLHFSSHSNSCFIDCRVRVEWDTPVGRHLAVLRALHHSCHSLHEDGFNVVSSQSWALHVPASKSLGQSLAFFSWDAPLHPKVSLISNDKHCTLTSNVVFELLDPVFDCTVALPLGQVEDKQSELGIAKEVLRKVRTSSLLPSCVPDLELDESLLEDEGLEFEVTSNCALAGEGNVSVDELEEERGLPHERVTQHHHLQEAVVASWAHFPHYLNTINPNLIHPSLTGSI